MIDYEQLRNDLIDYYGTAMTGPFPMAVMEITRVEKASDEELIMIAKKEHFSLDKYQEKDDFKGRTF